MRSGATCSVGWQKKAMGRNGRSWMGVVAMEGLCEVVLRDAESAGKVG